MEERELDRVKEGLFTPAEYISLMFELTKPDGTLRIPGWELEKLDPDGVIFEDFSAERSYLCKLDWNEEKRDRILEKFEKIYDAMDEISLFYEELKVAPKRAGDILLKPELQEVWDTYLEPLDAEDFDTNRYSELLDRAEKINFLHYLQKRVPAEEITEDEKELMEEYTKLSLSQSEVFALQLFFAAFRFRAAQRLGESPSAFNVLQSSKRLLFCLAKQAPEAVLQREGCQFAATLVLHEYGLSKALVRD